MKRLKLSKELFFGSVLIGVLSIGLASCGAGGGGTSSGSIGITSPLGGIPSLPSGGGTSQSSGGTTSQPSCAIASPSSLSFGSYIYQGTDYFNEPVITVYIDGQPVQLLADTGDDGLVVNQSAVNIPSSDYYASSTFAYVYGDGSYVSGVFASATVCLNPSITNSCVVMPIGVNTAGNAFSSSTGTQGDFGLESGLYGSIPMDSGTILSSSTIYSFTGYSYPTYLAQEYCINSFTISFFPLSNTYYEYASPTTPIGEISFGTNPPSTYATPNDSVLYSSNLSYSLFSVEFPPYNSVSFSSEYPYSSDTQPAFFDTGANFNFLTTDMLSAAIPNFSPYSDENASSCFSNTVSTDTMSNSNFFPFFSHVVNGGFNISYSILNSNTTNAVYYSTTFTTEPSNSFCSSGIQWNVMTGNTIDTGYEDLQQDIEVFGLPAMLNHTFVWVLNQGFAQGMSVDP